LFPSSTPSASSFLQAPIVVCYICTYFRYAPA
jgi:hypothetical protein